MIREYLKKIKPYYIGILSWLEVFALTIFYYFFWRIGYSHGYPGYPEYFGRGKYVLMAVYVLITGFLLFFSKGYRFGRVRVLNLVLKQWGIVLTVNIITYLQLSLIAGEAVAKRPLFEATIIQLLFVIMLIILADYSIKHYHVFGRMIVIGTGMEIGASVDGYRVFNVCAERSSILDLTKMLNMIEGYDAILIKEEDEVTPYIIEDCLLKRKPVYIAKKESLLYGVNRIHDRDNNYILIIGKETGEERFWDHVRAYLM